MDIIDFGTGILFGTATNDAAGNPLANPTPVRMGQLQEVSCEISFEEKMLHGAGQFPIAVGRGKGKIELKAKTATINGDVLGSLLFGTSPTQLLRDIVTDFAATIPATPYQVTITPPSSGTFQTDLGVLDATTGAPYTRVASAPATGQYTVTTLGVYTFAAADTTKSVLISYEYSAVSTIARVTSLTNQRMGQLPFFQSYLSTQYGSSKLTLALIRCASSKFSLPFKNDDFTTPDFDFSAFANPAGYIGYIATSQ